MPLDTTRLLSPFRVVLLFIALAAWGMWAIPHLKTNLLPIEISPVLNVSFSLPNSSPDVVEQQATSLLEGAFSQLTRLKKIRSVSDYNQGSVQLYFDKTVDMQMKWFETAALIRQVYHKLPGQASYPLISSNTNDEQRESPLLIYSISAQLQPFQIKSITEKVFRQTLAAYPGVKEVVISGVENLQLTLRCDKEKCSAWQIDPGSIATALNYAYADVYPGHIKTENGREYFVRLAAAEADVEGIKNLLIKSSAPQLYHLKDIADVYIEEQETLHYFRINGKNSINLSLYARKGENKIALGRQLKSIIDNVKKHLPKGYEIRLEHDDTEFLEKEISKNYKRAGLSIAILMLFIILAYRSWKYLLNLFLGLIVSLSLTAIFVWLFGVDIHLYTIAGLAIAFGLMIDNSIVMLDYFHQFQNRKVFMALLAATFTTVSALCLVFFLPDEDRKNLGDFSLIIILALMASMLSALWFTPAIYLLFNPGLKVKAQPLVSINNNKRKLKSQHIYFGFIALLACYRKAFIALVVLGFGLPLFMLPAKWEGEKWHHRFYNSSIGAETYQEIVKPYADKITGGALRLFINNVYEKSGYRNPEKTRLYIDAELPFGNTIDQLNYILTNFEKYLSSVEGIDKFVTNIYSGQHGLIEVTFKEGYDQFSLPYQLKSRLISRSLNWGGVDWSIYGVGQGFSNAGGNEIPGFRVTMKGYNYDELERQANYLAEKLVTHKRIQKVNTNERMGYGEKQSSEYVLNLDARQMTLHHTSRFELLSQLNNLSKPTGPVGQITINNRYYPVVLKEKESDQYSSYDLLHNSIHLDTSRTVKIDKFGKLELRTIANSIHKEDRQYIRIVGFEYMGSSQFGSKYLTEVLDEMKPQMPVGYTAEQESWNWDGGWGKAKRQYSLIFILIVAIFFICSILFENLKEPFFIISIIPISFIGLFLIFAWGDFYFDQGGYAAFVMLGGLVVNAAIFIVNDFNNLKKKNPLRLHNRLLIKATANRTRTILLTNISTCCGLIPFLIEGQNEIFWFSLAIGTIGGLIFSLFAIFIVLPVFLWKNEDLLITPKNR